MLPIQIYVGPLRLSPYRIFLIAALIPCLIMWLSGRAGKIRAPDVLLIFHALWAFGALLLAHGLAGGVQPGGIYFIEVVTPYLLARCYIRSASDYESIVRMIFVIIAIFIPFVVYESVTGHHVLIRSLDIIFDVFAPHYMEPRWGLSRAFGLFEHPILYGVFCASSLGLVYYALRHERVRIKALLRSAMVIIATFFSLSAGPLVALVAQLGLIAWDRMTRRISYRWRILGILFLVVYIAVDIMSNRTPVEVFISYLTFNAGNSYNRIHIWYYGTAEISRHPLFGIGLNEWQRAFWMSASMDNFWLVIAVRYGLPALIMYGAAIFLLGNGLRRLQLTDLRMQDYRKGWLVSVCGVAIAASTVHLWNAVFCFFMFILGTIVWMLDQKSNKLSNASNARNEISTTAPP